MGGVQLMTAFAGVRRGAMALVLGLLMLVGLGAGASVSAQESGGEVKGNLVQKDDDGERVGVPGVIFRAFNESGTEVASTTTAEDGSWSMIVPEGSYDILLDVETLPDGVSLRNPDKNPASVTVMPSPNSRPRSISSSRRFACLRRPQRQRLAAVPESLSVRATDNTLPV